MRPTLLQVATIAVCSLILLASCKSNTKSASPAATAPASIPAPNQIDRLTSRHPELKSALATYREKEGDQHRGDHFVMLAQYMDIKCFGKSAFRRGMSGVDYATELEVLSFLGLPDSGFREGNDAVYVYSYWRDDTKSKWVAIVQISDGKLQLVGWNDARVNDFSNHTKYGTWSDVMRQLK